MPSTGLYFKLDGMRVVPVDDLLEASIGIKVAEDKVGSIIVSTVFLGINHAWNDAEMPVLFETMVFGGAMSDTQSRYCTYEEALVGHAEILEMVLRS